MSDLDGLGAIIFLPLEGRAFAYTTARGSAESARVVADLTGRACLNCEVYAALAQLVAALEDEVEDAAPGDVGFGCGGRQAA